MLTNKALHGLAPQYLSELLTVYTPRRNLRSSDSGFLIVPSTHLRSMGDQAFSSVAPKLWNSLPTEIRYALLEFLNLHLKLFQSSIQVNILLLLFFFFWGGGGGHLCLLI